MSMNDSELHIIVSAGSDFVRSCFHLFQTILDFILGRILNPIILGAFTFLFIFSWTFFFGVVITGFAAIAWANRAEAYAWLTGRKTAAGTHSEAQNGSFGGPKGVSEGLKTE
ncbi:MAG: hypothetical protein M1818_000328 [Claussenomyces sp. TS43310]|nr:MAG: hypothetical protein M1818_000328 [Claussenomyces sp. TS43310]